MLVTKPKNNQLLLEDDSFENFDLGVHSKTGLVDSEFDKIYEALILCYRLPGMDASKQMFYGDRLSVMTLLSSTLQNLLTYHIIDEESLDDVVSSVKHFVKEGTYDD